MSERSDKTLYAARVPGPLEDLFIKAQQNAEQFFGDFCRDPKNATISASGNRFIMLRAASVSIEFIDLVASLYTNRSPAEARSVAHGLLFDIAHAIGRADARHLHESMGISDTVEKLSLGPVFFAFCGWAGVRIHPESTPAPNEDFVFYYDHEGSFEADAWQQSGRRADEPVCVMNAGYASGWGQECVGIDLVAVEVECTARGDDHCRFVMAPPHRIDDRIAECAQNNQLSNVSGLESFRNAEVPEFFQRKRLEEELRKERDFIKSVVDVAPVLVCVLDKEGSIVRFNRACEQVTGYTSQEVVGRLVWEKLLTPEETDSVQEVFADILKGNFPCQFENDWATKDGSRRRIQWYNSVTLDSQGKVKHIIGTGIDITERQALQCQLLQAQKLEAVGQLAAGIAHEINTPTQYVSDNTHFLIDGFRDLAELFSTCLEIKKTADDGGPTDELVRKLACLTDEIDLSYLNEEIPLALEQCREGLGQIARIVRAMKEFAHPGSGDKKLMDINKVLESTTTVSRNEWKYCAQLETDFEEPLPVVPCLPGEMGQVFLNMVVNAAYAIQDRQKTDKALAGVIRITTRQGNGWVEIGIEDNGSGISEDARARMFDPFYTTKEVGRGSGQGLTIAHNIVVDKHAGSIDCQTQEGEGTTFRIRLPLPEKL